MFRQRELNVAVDSKRSYRVRRDDGRRRTAQHEPLDGSNEPTAMQMIARADELRNRGKHADAEAIFADMACTYLSKKMFNSAGSFFKKAKLFGDAGAAFMKSGEYFSAARCFERAKDKKNMVAAYRLAADKAAKHNDLGIAQHSYRKAGCIGHALNMGKRAKRMKEEALARKMERDRRRRQRLSQKHGGPLHNIETKAPARRAGKAG